jgi:hypothetical protein
MALNWSAIFASVKDRIQRSGVRAEEGRLGPQTTGIFDGLSIVTNCDCDRETQSHNLVHSFGHITQWSVERSRCETLYEKLHTAKELKDADSLERALRDFRAYEEEASGYAAWLLIDTGNAAAVPSFTPFARADIEAIVSYHREGVAPVWNEFFAAWQARAERKEIEIVPFEPRQIPPFTPCPIAPQEIVRGIAVLQPSHSATRRSLDLQ